MRKSFVYRLYPTRTQVTALTGMLETQRLLYNRALHERKMAWKTEQRGVTYGSQSAMLKTQRTDNPSLGLATFSSCQRTLKRLDRAFAAFFRRLKAGDTPGYPRFRGAGRFHTVEYTHRDGCRSFGSSVYVRNVGRVKVKQHRSTSGTIKTASLTRRADGWHLVLVCDVGDAVGGPKDGPALGIDLGLASFLVTSEGEVVAPPRFSRSAQAALRRAQRKVARRNKGSNRCQKAAHRVAKLHLRVANQRRDFHHKTALALVRRYGTVCHEALNVRSLVRSRLAKSTHDAGWGGFLTILQHKAASAGVAVVAVPPYNTSQVCSSCGASPAVPKTLRDRVHTCPCGYTADRDHNAARNILLVGTGTRPGLGRQDTTRALALVS